MNMLCFWVELILAMAVAWHGYRLYQHASRYDMAFFALPIRKIFLVRISGASMILGLIFCVATIRWDAAGCSTMIGSLDNYVWIAIEIGYLSTLLVSLRAWLNQC